MTAWPGGASTRGLSPTRYPHLASAAPCLAEVDEDDRFETALALLLNAVELRARRTR
ncbi:TetR/AcrR family transcriptional regulator C-terminal domain-containing protein [Streptomyces sp. NPDC047985]|uniref:TetR/AcrR family transcriptional regulator C-terminal domain-containing protein n=1 Tax=unclassified Streptomyces TaxID=2593676 RepID=UPI003420702B